MQEAVPAEQPFHTGHSASVMVIVNTQLVEGQDSPLPCTNKEKVPICDTRPFTAPVEGLRVRPEGSTPDWMEKEVREAVWTMDTVSALVKE